MTRATDGELEIRAFAPGDAAGVRDLFIRVNRLLAPPEMKGVFEAYIAGALKDEIDKIADYYRERDGGFWVAADGGKIVGTFGVEASGDAQWSCVACTSIRTCAVEALRDGCCISPRRSAAGAVGHE